MIVIVIILIIPLVFLQIYLRTLNIQQYQKDLTHPIFRTRLKALVDAGQIATDESERIRVRRIATLYKIYLGLWTIEILAILLLVLGVGHFIYLFLFER
jgi:hypothetical protein